jgi:hypothetical protein
MDYYNAIKYGRDVKPCDKCLNAQIERDKVAYRSAIQSQVKELEG